MSLYQRYKSTYKCARCGKRIKRGEEYWVGKTPYGKECYQIVTEAIIAFERALAIKHG